MLPGKLTAKHIELAEQRGEDFIIYKKRIYTLEELRGLNRSGEVKPKSKVNPELVRPEADNSDRKIVESSRDISKSRTYKSNESVEGITKGTSE